MKITIHIGLEKTGTTSIQGFLNHRRAELLAKGVLFPEAPGKSNQTLLAAAAMSDPVNIRARAIAQGGADFADTLAQNMRAEIAAAKPERLLLSNEHCSSRLHSVEEVTRLRTLLEQFGEVERVIVYLRRQDEFLLSTYSTSVKSGDSRPFALPSDRKMRSRYDFQALLELWAGVFGREAMQPRRFQPSAWAGGDLLSDFCAAAGLEVGDRSAPARNLSLSAEGLEFLRLLNKEKGGIRDGRVVRAVGAATKGPKLSLSTAERRAFVQSFDDSNHRVSETFFDGAPLFEPVPDGLEDRGLPDLAPARIEALRAAVAEALDGAEMKLSPEREARRAARAAGASRPAKARRPRRQ